VRPGEKLYEELSTMLEDTVSTTHEKIRIFVGNGVPECDMFSWLDNLREICDMRDTGRLAVALKEIVTDFSPSAHFLKRIVQARDQPALDASSCVLVRADRRTEYFEKWKMKPDHCPPAR
jgi:hypothetical protein